eukprot:410007-Rhodomonas_salina.1
MLLRTWDAKSGTERTRYSPTRCPVLTCASTSQPGMLLRYAPTRCEALTYRMLLCARRPVRCGVLVWRMTLRTRYAMWGAGIAYGAMQRAVWCYAVWGTELGYGATRMREEIEKAQAECKREEGEKEKREREVRGREEREGERE